MIISRCTGLDYPQVSQWITNVTLITNIENQGMGHNNEGWRGDEPRPRWRRGFGERRWAGPDSAVLTGFWGDQPYRRRYYLRCSGRLWFCRCHSRRCTLPCCSLLPSWWPTFAPCRLIGREYSSRERFRYRLWTIWPLRQPYSARRTEWPRPSRRRCSFGA